MDKSKVIRKPDPSKRKNIFTTTLKKVETFLKNQELPIFKSEIVRQLGVNYNSLNMALEMLPIKTDQEGRIQIKKRGKEDLK